MSYPDWREIRNSSWLRQHEFPQVVYRTIVYVIMFLLTGLATRKQT